jgi:two-component system sensor histidine kinase AlgZ
VTAQPAASPADFFLPDLCAAEAVLFAVLLAELVVLLHVLALGPLASFDWVALAMGSAFVQLNSLLCLGLLCRLRPALRRLGPAPTALACLLLVACVTALTSIAVNLLYPQLWPARGALGDWVARNCLLALLLAAIVLRYAWLQQRVAVQQRAELQLRLDALQARMRPHFLFNTLNSIASLIGTDPTAAERAIEDMAELLRAALRADRGPSSLGEERRLCELYLGIERLRLGERLQVDWQQDDGTAELPLPPLLLQPLLENAVYHGISRLPEGGTVRVGCHIRGSQLQIEVRNPLSPQPAASGNRMALDNIRQRLLARYGAAASVELASGPDEFRVLLSLPVPGGVRS